MSMLDREYREKRNFIRMQVNTQVKVSLADEEFTYEGICRDLSGSGMLLTINQEIPLNTQLKVTVISGHGHGPMLEANCSVARIEPGPGSSYLIGLEIKQVLNQPQNKQIKQASNV